MKFWSACNTVTHVQKENKHLSVLAPRMTSRLPHCLVSPLASAPSEAPLSMRHESALLCLSIKSMSGPPTLNYSFPGFLPPHNAPQSPFSKGSGDKGPGSPDGDS